MDAGSLCLALQNVEQGRAIVELLKEHDYRISRPMASRILASIRGKVSSVELEGFLQGLTQFLGDDDCKLALGVSCGRPCLMCSGLALPLAFEAALQTTEQSGKDHLTPMLHSWATRVELNKVCRLWKVARYLWLPVSHFALCSTRVS